MQITQWLSPGYPVSAYAYSHGLEADMAQGLVSDAAALEAWIATVLRAGAGRMDALLLLAAARPEGDTAHLSTLARALAGSAERWEETCAQGSAFARTQRAMGQAVPDAPYPVAVGCAARRLALPPETLAALYLHAFAANLVSAAVRFVPLGQVEGQSVLAALKPVMGGVAREVAAVPEAALEAALGGAAFGAEIAAMAHETLEVRLFRT